MTSSSLVCPSDIAVVSMAVGSAFKKSVKIGIENKRLYCKTHGYDFICGEEHLDPSRHIVWSKILQIQKVLENSAYKWIFWTDADSLIMNSGTRLEDFLDENYNLIIAVDQNSINFGQFFLKNCPWSIQLLSDMYARTECIDHPWREQQALIVELQKKHELMHFIKIVPQRLFNSYHCPAFTDSFFTAFYQTGDFILHFPGVRNLTRLSKLFRIYKKMVINCPERANSRVVREGSSPAVNP
jgi:hypothetical protein